ncbi:hypothetical protein MIMGU_mgv1a017468mg [Erythranthe guttata]|uniref:Uncharacterized protein n=1 Tax=Erythranthe guttata TaxID=4155 RepID=A0A022S0D7_ERYGU|nr:hypothetical protein MIMGU_mgv1a017468mg [Erythranthe guttata]
MALEWVFAGYVVAAIAFMLLLSVIPFRLLFLMDISWGGQRGTRGQVKLAVGAERTHNLSINKPEQYLNNKADD